MITEVGQTATSLLQRPSASLQHSFTPQKDYRTDSGTGWGGQRGGGGTIGGRRFGVHLHAVKEDVLGLFQVAMLHQGQARPGGLMYAAPLPQAIQDVLLRKVTVQLRQCIKTASLLHSMDMCVKSLSSFSPANFAWHHLVLFCGGLLCYVSGKISCNIRKTD